MLYVLCYLSVFKHGLVIAIPILTDFKVLLTCVDTFHNMCCMYTSTIVDIHQITYMLTRGQSKVYRYSVS